MQWFPLRLLLLINKYNFFKIFAHYLLLNRFNFVNVNIKLQFGQIYSICAAQAIIKLPNFVDELDNVLISGRVVCNFYKNNPYSLQQFY